MAFPAGKGLSADESSVQSRDVQRRTLDERGDVWADPSRQPLSLHRPEQGSQGSVSRTRRVAPSPQAAPGTAARPRAPSGDMAFDLLSPGPPESRPQTKTGLQVGDSGGGPREQKRGAGGEPAGGAVASRSRPGMSTQSCCDLRQN